MSISLSLGLSERTGMYDCPVPHNHKHTDAIEEIGLWQQWLTGQGVDSIILLGHSRGGNQTAWYASELKEGSPVKGTVLIAPASNGFDYLAADYKKRYEVDLAPLVEKANKLVADGKGDTMMENVDFIYCQKTSATAASFANYYADDPRMETTYILKEFSQPVMVFAGSEDTVVVNLEEKIEALGEKENIQMSVIDGADHFFRDLHAEDLADETVEFIESL
ncbi:alpha/beta fold hydrolase [Solemya velum gill symbiont]|uniref:alpha/beta fold hydrolase n=1 Tax=Solemya velum gill symbiont TaxID=2340 RepID=UPI0015C404F6|nr:alpha/beta hydrolase [Solemya velum gill symbiont]